MQAAGLSPPAPPLLPSNWESESKPRGERTKLISHSLNKFFCGKSRDSGAPEVTGDAGRSWGHGRRDLMMCDG